MFHVLPKRCKSSPANDEILDLYKLKTFERIKHKYDSKIEICFGKDRQDCGVLEKMLLTNPDVFQSSGSCVAQW